MSSSLTWGKRNIFAFYIFRTLILEHQLGQSIFTQSNFPRNSAKMLDQVFVQDVVQIFLGTSLRLLFFPQGPSYWFTSFPWPSVGSPSFSKRLPSDNTWGLAGWPLWPNFAPSWRGWVCPLWCWSSSLTSTIASSSPGPYSTLSRHSQPYQTFPGTLVVS